jgi:hypothetical protein
MISVDIPVESGFDDTVSVVSDNDVSPHFQLICSDSQLPLTDCI